MYSTAQMQRITNTHSAKRANAFGQSGRGVVNSLNTYVTSIAR